MVEVTEILDPAPNHDAVVGPHIPDVAQKVLDESSPNHNPEKKPPAHVEAAVKPTVGVPGAHRIHILMSTGGRVKETVSDDLADVVRAIEAAGTHELWIDIEADDAERALAPFDTKVSTEHFVVQNHEKRSVLGWPYLVRDHSQPRFCVLVAPGDAAIVTVHPPDTEHDPVGGARKVMDSAVHARTEGGYKQLGSFREFVFLQIAESAVTEVMGVIQRLSKRLGQVYDNVYAEDFKPAAIQTALFDIHRLLDGTVSPTIFLLREFFFTLERGGARFLPLEEVRHDLTRLVDELDRLMGLKTNMETTIELISNAVRSKLSEQALAASMRLQMAVEVLVRVSLLLMIPTAIFSLWPMMPFPVDAPVTFLGITMLSVGWCILTALLLTAMAQFALFRIYSKSYGIQEMRASPKVNGAPKSTPPK